MSKAKCMHPRQLANEQFEPIAQPLALTSKKYDASAVTDSWVKFICRRIQSVAKSFTLSLGTSSLSWTSQSLGARSSLAACLVGLFFVIIWE